MYTNSSAFFLCLYIPGCEYNTSRFNQKYPYILLDRACGDALWYLLKQENLSESDFIHLEQDIMFNSYMTFIYKLCNGVILDTHTHYHTHTHTLSHTHTHTDTYTSLKPDVY